MKCKKCGTECMQGTKFCPYCGEMTTETKKEDKKIRKKSIVIIGIMILLIVGIIGIFVCKQLSNNWIQKAIQCELDSKYEDAIQFYGRAYLLKPGNDELEEYMSNLYLKWARGLWRLNNEEGALELLQTAKVQTEKMEAQLGAWALEKATCKVYDKTEKYDECGKVIENVEYDYVYDDEGVLLNYSIYKNGILNKEYIYQYNQYGDNVLTINNEYGDNEDSRTYEYVYAYDENGYVIEKKEIDSHGDDSFTKFQYDTVGTIMGYEKYTLQGVLLEKADFDKERLIYTKISYENGIEYSRSTYNRDGQLLTYKNEEREYEYTYDNRGNIVERRFFENSKIYAHYTYIYDKEGLLVKAQRQDGEGKYTYYTVGVDLVRNFITKTPLEIYPSIGDYSYDAEKKLRSYTSYDSDGKVSKICEYEYDDADRLKNYYVYKMDNTDRIVVTERKYDDFENEIEERIYDANGCIETVYYKEYKYIEH